MRGWGVGGLRWGGGWGQGSVITVAARSVGDTILAVNANACDSDGIVDMRGAAGSSINERVPTPTSCRPPAGIVPAPPALLPSVVFARSSRHSTWSSRSGARPGPPETTTATVLKQPHEPGASPRVPLLRVPDITTLRGSAEQGHHSPTPTPRRAYLSL